MDTNVVRQRIRAGLRRPPVVRSCASRSDRVWGGAAEGLWVTSWEDLLVPEGGVAGQRDIADPLPLDDLTTATATATASDAATATVTEVDAVVAAGEPVEQLRAVLSALGVGPRVVESLTELSLACATVAAGDEQPNVVARGQALLGAVETLTGTAGTWDAVLLSATEQLTVTTGRLLLADKGATCPEELSVTAREKWRSRAKALVRHEIEAVTGWGAGEVGDLVGLANTPAVVTAPVAHALGTGEGAWRLARRFFRECAGLDTADAAAIANGLFGTDPKAAVTERLDSAGEWTGRPWSHQEYYRALSREVTQVRSRDPESTKRTREQNLAANDVRANVDELGTACVMIGCGATQGAAITDRIERAARAARRAGDPRPLSQLRVAVAVALLLHGTLDLADLPEDPALITVGQSEQLTKILHGLPTAELNVIVPLGTLLGTTPAGLAPTGVPGLGATGATDAEGRPIPTAFANPDAAGAVACTCACTCGATAAARGHAAAGEDRPHPGPTGQSCPPPGEPAGEVGVGEVIGRHSLFLTPEECRTLALTPGSTLYRLLTDPVTGTLLERSSKAYRFDAAMRAHIIAADVFCRAPGCLKPACLSQIDHVQEHGTPGGHTCIANGQSAHEPHHDLKTKKAWDAVIAANRDVTWTTLLGRIYTTKAHDYRQYTKLLTAATTQVHDAIRQGADPATAVDAAVYQALSYRPPGAALQADDDGHDWQDRFTGWDQITLTHTPDSGRRTYHPAPEASRAEADRMNDTRTPDPAAINEPDVDADCEVTDECSTQAQATEGQSTDIRTTDGDGPSTPWARGQRDDDPPF